MVQSLVPDPDDAGLAHEASLRFEAPESFEVLQKLEASPFKNCRFATSQTGDSFFWWCNPQLSGHLAEKRPDTERVEVTIPAQSRFDR